MKIKVCGMTSVEQLEQLERLGADFAGFIFYSKSARYVGDKLVHHLPTIKGLQLERVGVFVNESVDEVKKRIEEYNLQYVQLHGDESPEMCRVLQGFASVIKAIRIGDAIDLNEQLKKYEGVCDYFLFDTDSKQYGGTGKQFNWQLLQQVVINKPFFLSGGIGLADMERIKELKHQMLYSLDVNSKFETAPGVKDMDSLTSFFAELK